MGEQQWLTGVDTGALLGCEAVRGLGRKVRLFNCGCARQLAGWVTDSQAMKALDASERYADGSTRDVTLDGWGRKAHKARDVHRRRTTFQTEGIEALALHAVCYAASADRYAGCRLIWSEILRLLPQHDPELAADLQVRFPDLLRCVFGNSFRPVAFDTDWRTTTVEALAAGCYAERAFDRLPVLADALEDAGCGAADLLAHLRGPGPHVRGCWPLDLVLGKS